MKKFIRFILILVLIIAAIYLANHYFLSGKSSYQSIYLVPSNASWIIESDAPFNAWDKIVHSSAWITLSKIESLAELNVDIKEIDSVLSEQIFLLRALGNKNAMISAHEYSSGKFDYLYILNLGKITRLRNPEKIIASFLGDEYPITKRIFDDKTIYEMLDRESDEMYIFTFLHDKIIFSTNYMLIEASIKEMSKMTLGRDLEFINVSKRVSGKGLFNLYINYQYFPGYLRYMLGKPTEKIEKLKNELGFSAFAFDITSDGLISLEGYTNVFDSVPSFYSTVLNTTSGNFSSSKIIPARVASLVKISFDDASAFYSKSLTNLNPQDLAEFQSMQQKMEKKLKINIQENIINWIDDEIVLLQTNPSNLGRTNEFAAIIKARNGDDAKTNLEFIARQIKKNTPVKVKNVNYEGYTIHYISFPGLIKALFGKILEKIEKPYFTQIDDYVIFSNHPQTLKNIIDDYLAKNTLEFSDTYNEFSKQFDRRQGALTYMDIPVLFSNLKEFVNAETWKKMNTNKPYITTFHQAGVQIDRKDDLLHLIIKARYEEEFDAYTKLQFSTDFLSQFMQADSGEIITETIEDWTAPKIQINDLDSKFMEWKNENGILEYTIELKNGLKHGSYKAYYKDGSVKVTGKFKNDLRHSTWKYYNSEGDLIEEKEFEEGREKIE